MSEIKNNSVQETVQNLVGLNKLVQHYVQQLINIRKEAGFSQQFIADWLNVDRRKIISLENGAIDIELLCIYAEKLDIQINFEFVYMSDEPEIYSY
jgi:DNA-binding XRE family transcriptional regulator